MKRKPKAPMNNAVSVKSKTKPNVVLSRLRKRLPARPNETHFVKIHCEAIIGFAGNAYLPRELCRVPEFLAAGLRELGMLDKPPGEIPVWIQNAKLKMGLYFPKVCYPSEAKELPTSAELAAAEIEVMAEWAKVKEERAKAKELLKMARSATYGKAERKAAKKKS